MAANNRRLPAPASRNPQLERRAAPSLAELNRYDVNRRGQPEAVWAPLYDYTAYAAAGQTSLSFFQIPIGGLVGGVAKTLADTNMRASGQLPAPQNFLIQSVSVIFFPGVPVSQTAAGANAVSIPEDCYNVLNTGVLRLRVGSKDYIEHSPLLDFPQLTRLDGFAALSEAAAAATPSQTAYAASSGHPFNVTPIRLIPNQNFSVTLEWPAAVPVPSTIAARIGVKLSGYLYRDSQ